MYKDAIKSILEQDRQQQEIVEKDSEASLDKMMKIKDAITDALIALQAVRPLADEVLDDQTLFQYNKSILALNVANTKLRRKVSLDQYKQERAKASIEPDGTGSREATPRSSAKGDIQEVQG